MASKERSPELDDLDNYFLHEDLEDDPFASPNGDNSASKKRKSPGDGLGLDEEVSVEKKARIPRIKLDRDRYAEDLCNLAQAWLADICLDYYLRKVYRHCESVPQN